MKLFKRLILLLAVLSFSISCSARNITYSSASSKDVSQKETKLDKKIKNLQKEFNVPNVGLGIIKNGKLIETKVYGKLKNGKNAPQDTLFSVASISKAVFTMLVMKLVEEGKWNLDDPLFKYHVDEDIADNPFHKKLTTRILLSHQGGFPSWRRGRLTFNSEPNTGFSYSGEGIFYVQRAVEKKFGKPLEELAKEKVFSPMGLKDMRFAWDGERDIERFSRWFDHFGNEHISNHANSGNSAYSLVTTVEDLSKFGIEVMNGFGLSEKLFNEMIQSQTRISPNLEQAIGWRLVDNLENEEYAIYHGGNQRGSSATLILLPKSKNGIVVITNGDNGLMIVNGIVRGVLPNGKEIIHRAYKRTKLEDVPKIYDINEKILNSYAGTYSATNGRELKVIRKENQLQTIMPRGRHFKYFAESDTKFFQKDLDIKLEFVKNKQEKVEALIIVEGDNRIRFERKN